MLKADGSTLVTPTYLGTNGGTISTGSLPVTGSYMVVIDPQGDDTGSATVAAS